MSFGDNYLKSSLTHLISISNDDMEQADQQPHLDLSINHRTLLINEQDDDLDAEIEKDVDDDVMPIITIEIDVILR